MAAAARGLGEGRNAEAADRLSAAADELRTADEPIGRWGRANGGLGNRRRGRDAIGNGQGGLCAGTQSPGSRPADCRGVGGDLAGRGDGVGWSADEPGMGITAGGWRTRGAGRPIVGGWEPSSALVLMQVRGQVSPGGDARRYVARLRRAGVEPWEHSRR